MGCGAICSAVSLDFWRSFHVSKIERFLLQFTLWGIQTMKLCCEG